MNESLAEDRLPTLSGAAPEQPTPPCEPFDELPTLGGNGPGAPAEAPVIAGYEILEEIGREDGISGAAGGTGPQAPR